MYTVKWKTTTTTIRRKAKSSFETLRKKCLKNKCEGEIRPVCFGGMFLTLNAIIMVYNDQFGGNGGVYTISFTHPQKKWPYGVRSGDLGGQLQSFKSLGPLRPIQRLGSVSFRKPRTYKC